MEINKRMKVFEFDGPVFSFFSRVTEIVMLNIVTLIFCIPLITIGASITAAHYTALKMRREEGHVLSNFWRSFKENFKQSTGMWMCFVVYYGVSLVAYNIANKESDSTTYILKGFIMAMVLIVVFVYVWALPLQAKFINSVVGTLKTSFYMAFKYLIRTLFMMILNLLPIVTLVFIVLFTGMRGFGIWMMFGIALPIYLCAMMYNKIFEKMEEAILGKNQIEEE